MTTHFHNFTPADAVQYDGEHGDEALFDVVRSEIRWGGQEGWPIRKGQWLVHQGDKVWVQDEEPASVIGASYHQCHAKKCEPDCALKDCAEYLLDNGWTSPWSPVEGGAE